ncbi:MAG: hypothetical protein KJO90_07210, partial [Eudoraea sp.]|nr:hypothetical protein [Eudoraea sp.]
MDIPTLLKSCYGLNAQEIEPLEGYGSSNFRVDTLDGRFILKRYKYSVARQGLLQVEYNVIKVLDALSTYQFPRVIESSSQKDHVESD